MEPLLGWEAQLDQLSTHRLGHLVGFTGYFIQTVRKRWAAGQFVPSWCTVAWIDGLAGQVASAGQRLADGGPAGLGGPPSGHTAPPAAQGAVPPTAAEREQWQIAVIRMHVRRVMGWGPAAHERAAELQEQAAEIQARLGHQDRADQARRFAVLARDRIFAAYAKQGVWEATLEALGRPPAAAAIRPNPDEPTI
jgi:hypothetical protein